jgi:hypothetical protein
MDPQCKIYIEQFFIDDFYANKIDEQYAKGKVIPFFRDRNAKDKTYPTIFLRRNKDGSIILTSSLDKQ